MANDGGWFAHPLGACAFWPATGPPEFFVARMDVDSAGCEQMFYGSARRSDPGRWSHRGRHRSAGRGARAVAYPVMAIFFGPARSARASPLGPLVKTGHSANDGIGRDYVRVASRYDCHTKIF